MYIVLLVIVNAHISGTVKLVNVNRMFIYKFQ